MRVPFSFTNNSTMKKTKKQYEQYLNAASPEQGSELWIIGGAIRMTHMWTSKYGTALRKYDSIAFETGYHDWAR